MTPDQAIDALADEVTSGAMQEVIDNGLIDSYLDGELDEAQYRALRSRLEGRIAARPSPATLSSAFAVLTRGAGR